MRIRTIKPEFWTNEELSTLSIEANMLAIGLLNYADDEGYFNANPDLVKAAIFPLRRLPKSIDMYLSDLCKIDYISLIDCQDGRRYGRVVNFSQHQVISHPKTSKIASKFDDSSNVPVMFHECSSNVPSLNGMEQGTGNREHDLQAYACSSSGDDASGVDSKKSKPVPTDWIMAMWNQIADPRLPRCARWTTKRKQAAKTRLGEYPDEETWKSAIEAINKSDFCTGGGPRGWKANIDWLLRPETITKLIEGQYEDGKGRLTDAQRQNAEIMGQGSGDGSKIDSGCHSGCFRRHPDDPIPTDEDIGRSEEWFGVLEIMKDHDDNGLLRDDGVTCEAISDSHVWLIAPSAYLRNRIAEEIADLFHDITGLFLCVAINDSVEYLQEHAN